MCYGINLQFFVKTKLQYALWKPFFNCCCWNECCQGSITEEPVVHICPYTLDCCAAVASCSALLIVMTFFSSQRLGVTCWWGTALWWRTSHLARLSGRPPSPPAGCPCHSLTDRYKVTTVCSEVLNSPLSLSCPGTKPDCLTLSTCLFVSSLNYSTSRFLCTPGVIENMWLKKGRDVHHWTWLHPTGATVKWSLWKMISACGILIMKT